MSKVRICTTIDFTIASQKGTKQMTREELAKFDGKEGRKAYVAVSGNIYDFSESKMWVDGNHQDAHLAGCDLTEELKVAPHVRAVIERFPVVGKLEEAAPATKSSGGMTVGIILIGIVIALVAFFALK